MRELRDFELQDAGTPVAWRVPEGQRLIARRGRLWLTVEGDAADIWLAPGMAHELPAGRRVWLSGETPGAAFTLAQRHGATRWSGLIARLIGARLAAGRPAGSRARPVAPASAG